ncbi:hypothetical protein C8J56DRAFT_1064015 [Mycena floridula]|nr:hypothetical protein C8J56DRAFT_1064015 [Mycena floridula]
MSEVHNSRSESNKKFQAVPTGPLKAQDSLPQFDTRALAPGMLKRIYRDDDVNSHSEDLDVDAMEDVEESNVDALLILPPAPPAPPPAPQDYRVQRLANQNHQLLQRVDTLQTFSGTVIQELDRKAAEVKALHDEKLRMEADLARQAQELEDAKQELTRKTQQAEAKTKALERAQREADDIQRKVAEAAKKRRAQAEEARRKTEEEAMAMLREQAEQARRKTEEEARRKTEEEAMLREQAEQARRKTEEEARRKTEEETRRKTEEEAKLREEARRKTEEEVKLREDARRKTEEQAKRAEETPNNRWPMPRFSGRGMYGEADRLAKLQELQAFMRMPQRSPEPDNMVIDSEEPQPDAEHLNSPEQSRSSANNPTYNEGPSRTQHNETQAEDSSLAERVEECEREMEELRQTIRKLSLTPNQAAPQRRSNRPRSSKTSQESRDRGGPRGAGVNSFNAAIRLYINNLLEFEGQYDHEFVAYYLIKFHHVSMPSQPVLRPLHPDWSSLTNLWNRQLADMFVEDWKASDEGRKHAFDDDEVRQKFKQRITTLRGTFSQSLFLAGDAVFDNATVETIAAARLNQTRRSHRRNERRLELFMNRQKLARDGVERRHGATRDHWQMLFYMVQKLGAEGMSSDDSEGEIGSKIFVARVREWRSQPLLALLHHIDQNRTRYTTDLTDLGMLPDVELPGIELLDEVR